MDFFYVTKVYIYLKDLKKIFIFFFNIFTINGVFKWEPTVTNIVHQKIIDTDEKSSVVVI